MSEGIDVSSWQGAINFHQVAAAGKKFAIIRGGDGRYRDPNRMIYREGCLQAGLERDSYHFLRWHIPPAEMASICEETAGSIAVPHIWLDAEDTSDYFKALPMSARLNWLGEVIDRVTGKGLPNDLYTGRWWWVAYLNDTPVFNHKRIWAAEYPFSNSMQAYTWMVRPTLFGGWPKIDIWQYSSTGHVPGVQSVNTDLNWAFTPLYPKQEEDDDMVLSQTVIDGLEDMFARPFTDKNGGIHTSFYAFLKQVTNWLDTYHLANFYDALGIERDDVGNVTENELLEKVRALAQDGGTFPTVAAIAKAVNDDAAERQKE